MNFTSRLAMLLAGSTVLIGLNTVPASAAPQPPVQAPERAAEWTWTTSTGGPIRDCYSAGCAPVIGMAPGVQVQWSHYACNSSGNRWYYVRYPATSHWVHGWTHCANVTAGR